MNIIDWRINYECNNNCYYCFGYKKINHCTKTDKRIIQALTSSVISNITISGGEPLIEPNRLIGIINPLFEKGKKLYLSTNGLNFLDYYEEIKDKIAILGLPLDGYDESSNMINGRNKESFKQIIDILNHDKQTYKIKIGTVITNKNNNYDSLYKISRVLDRYDVSIWRIYEMIPENRGKINESLLLTPIDRSELRLTVKKIQEESHNYKIELVLREDRSKNYLIIQPDGSAIVPIDIGDIIEEIIIGDIKNCTIEELILKWKSIVNDTKSNYYRERILDFKQEIAF
mgnify:CR=1 FL=1